jgi:hypothetical protein
VAKLEPNNRQKIAVAGKKLPMPARHHRFSQLLLIPYNNWHGVCLAMGGMRAHDE